MTRLRYCDTRGSIAYHEKGTPGTQKPGLYPWFEVPGIEHRDIRIVCGHWSTLGRFQGLGIYAIETGIHLVETAVDLIEAIVKTRVGPRASLHLLESTQR